MNAEHHGTEYGSILKALLPAAMFGIAHLLLTGFVMLFTFEAGVQRFEGYEERTLFEFFCSIIFGVLTFPVVPIAAILERHLRWEFDPAIVLLLNSAFWGGCFMFATFILRHRQRRRTM